ncbi:hypothetical protein MRX96_021385 [Rhipicephalus microplus]
MGCVVSLDVAVGAVRPVSLKRPSYWHSSTIPNYDARRLEREGWLASALISDEQETSTKRAHRTDMANEWFRRNAPHPRVRKITFSVGGCIEKNEDKLPFRSIVRAKREPDGKKGPAAGAQSMALRRHGRVRHEKNNKTKNKLAIIA